MLTLKQTPTALTDWFTSEYPHIPLSVVHFATSGGVDQTRLNPFISRIIVLSRADDTEQRIRIYGCIFYGNEELFPLIALKSFVAPIELPFLLNVPVESREELSMDLIKNHINGTYFSLETLSIIISVGAYLDGFLQWFIKREMERVDLLPYLAYIDPQRLPDEEVTANDWQHLWNIPRMRPITPLPVWFRVPMHEYEFHPNLYIGGFYHIHCSQMNSWIWRKLTVNKAIKKPGFVHPEQAEFIIGYMVDIRKRRKQVALKDVAQIDALLPPCMFQILEGSGKFPKDLERQYAVRVLAKGGAPVEYIEKKLGVLNKKDPHSSGPINLQARWDYKHHHSAGYGAPRCETLIGCGMCPIAPGKLIDQKKDECFKLFRKRFPDKNPKAKSFYGPVQWFEW